MSVVPTPPSPLIVIAAAVALAAASPSAQAGVLPIKGVTASSTYTEQPGYDAARVADGRQGTAWVEGDSGAGLGAWVELDLGGPVKVDTLRIWGGDWYNDTNWNRANRPKEIEISVDGGAPTKVTLDNSRTVQSFPIGATASTVRVRIKSTYSGSTWLDTGISEIQLIGDAPAPGHEATLSASSHAPADGDGSYEPAMAADQLADTMWCEGDEGDGTGQSLTFDFGGKKSVSSLTWVNGIGGSLPLWMQANRATKVTLVFDGGEHTAEVRPSFKPTTLSFPSVSTSKVTVRFDAVLKGPKYNDLCVSEAWFAE